MRNIRGKMPITMWMELAYRIQRLKFTENSDEEFNRNIEKLQKQLSDLNICLEAKEREPKSIEDVGLATLLHDIYSLDVSSRCKKAAFYEKIYELYDLGIKNIEFRPVAFYDGISCAYKVVPNAENNETTIWKTYTDGKFNLQRHHGSSGEWFSLCDLKDADYLLHLKTLLCDNKQIFVRADAYVRTFDTVFPCVSEVRNDVHPSLILQSRCVTTEMNKFLASSGHEGFDSENVSCAKRLTRTPMGEFYYREFGKR